MRFECDAIEFNGCFIELSERWTLGERNKFFAVNGTGDEYLALLRAKTVALRLVDIDGNVLDDAAVLSTEGLQDIDARLFDWLVQTLPLMVVKVGTLGEPLRRRLWDSYGPARKTTPTNGNQPTAAEPLTP